MILIKDRIFQSDKNSDMKSICGSQSDIHQNPLSNQNMEYMMYNLQIEIQMNFVFVSVGKDYRICSSWNVFLTRAAINRIKIGYGIFHLVKDIRKGSFAQCVKGWVGGGCFGDQCHAFNYINGWITGNFCYIALIFTKNWLNVKRSREEI